MGTQKIEISENTVRSIILEILRMERKNLRSKARTDQKMAEELQKVIIEYSKMIH